MTRWYHGINTRYNIHFNGSESFNEALRAQETNHKESYAEPILMYPISALPKDKENQGGAFDFAIEKSVKSIKTHSIKTKPQKKAGKRNDTKYQQFYNQQEFNPFLHKSWMMMAQAQFYNADFLQAASTFSYISRHYATQNEVFNTAKIWQARCYSEMEWYYEAEDILSKINQAQLSSKQQKLFASIYADYLIKNEQYPQAIPYLKTAIKAEPNKIQKTRMKYLLGQIYTSLEQNELAYKAFGEVPKANPPYILEFSARIRQTEVYPGGNTEKLNKTLRKMAKNNKNKDYLDQVYYAMGNLYMTIPDTLKAIEAYEKGIEESTLNAMDKALCEIRVGDIFFEQKTYVKAQPAYSGALGQLKKEHKDYERVAKRSEMLDEFVVFYEAVHLQDSLQNLAQMPENERMAVIDKIIAEVIKKEKEEKEKIEQDKFAEAQESNRDNMPNLQAGSRPSATPANLGPSNSISGEFYFYNSQTVASGKNSFQQKWGRRKLEDDWRRKTKNNPMNEELADANDDNTFPENEALAETSSDSTSSEGDDAQVPENMTADNKKPEFYLQQIPLTEEDIEASNIIIQDGIYNMALIYKDKLEDYSLSLETFQTLEKRFPTHENQLDAYYNTYLIYLKMDDVEMYEAYKTKIIAAFPESKLAIAMAEPEYEYNMLTMDKMQDSLYVKAYNDYLEGNTDQVRTNYEQTSTRYAQSKLMPKFMFLNALSFVQTNEPDTFKVLLKELIDKYPDADVSVLAQEMMKGFQQGMSIAGMNGPLTRGSLFNIRLGLSEEEAAQLDSAITFSLEINVPYTLAILYKKGSANENLMLYNIAAFNFTNFTVNDFDLQFSDLGDVRTLQISGFNHYVQIQQYIKMIYQETGYMSKLDSAVIMLPISTENYQILTKGKSLEEYMNFFEQNFADNNSQLLADWHKRKIYAAREEEMEPDSSYIIENTQTSENIQNAGIEENIVADRNIEGEIIEAEIIEAENISNKDGLESNELTANKTDATADKAEDVLEPISKEIGNISDKLDSANETYSEFANDPIRGIKKLLSGRGKDNEIDKFAKQQEKEEKEKYKLVKKENADIKKETARLEKIELDSIKLEKIKLDNADKALLKEKQQHEKNLLKLKAEEKVQKEKDRKESLKSKEDLRKQKKDDLKRLRKEREIERAAKNKQKQAELKKKQEQRKENRKSK
ncbi:hypothetical protein AwDysgo_01920 [Bacteroidales bacterium]|nr:hypothetical protein AwDysgo_01920 [Bacteroidales bacterium]